MKKNITGILILICSLGLLWSCEKEVDLVNDFSTSEGMAFIKIVHASPNFRQVFKGRDSFNVYVNGAKLNGAFLTYNSVYPTLANLYAAVPAGPQSIRFTVNGVLTRDSITLASLNKTLEAGKYYSFIITDEALTANESRQMWIQDQFALTDSLSYTLRFINAVMNDPGAVDVYSFRNASNIFTNISPGTATPFIKLPYVFGTDTLYIRSTGTQNEIARVALTTGTTTTNTYNRGRAYTLLYKGAFGLTGTKARSATTYAND